mgnify:CR=1 FL=1
MENILQNAKKWLSDTFDTETKTEIKQLIDSNSDDLADRFYKDMEFGTGGMYDSSDMQQLGIPESYASQFRGDGKKNVNLPARPFFFSAVRVEYKKLFDFMDKYPKLNLRDKI